jgi:hypothetical protein
MGGIESKNDRQDDPRIEVADFDFDFRDDEEDFALRPRQRFVNPEHERHINRVNGCSLRRIFYNGWPLPSAGEAFGLTSSPPPPRRWRHYDDDGGFLHHSAYLGKTRDEISAVVVETAQEALEYDRIYINVVKTPVRENRHVSRTCAVNNNMAANQPADADAASSYNAGGSGSSGNASSGRREQQQLPEKDRRRQRIRFRETNW